ncbi:MAG: outer membrane beta-barrel domain-containing protein [Archangium gephyra]|uniref:Outer membrane beta-barrel domain-containing protein n=1 Tax=Archangium gephyra TaxID=48 RepID=A0A2W5TNX5_9BACT|nr:MAG: outer membrane beta-barrel domain-containing protein [Archangium gephyra]
MRSFRDSLLLAALMGAISAPAFAAPQHTDAPVLVAQASPSDDDEDDPAPAAATPAPTSTTPAATTAPARTDAPTAANTGSTQAPNADTQKLVSGAPLFNPNVAVHIIEEKKHSDAGKFEIVLYPATIQVNGKFTQHFGTMGSLVYHLQENFALQVTGGYNWYNVESSFNGELVEKFRVEAQAATSLLWTWGALGGVEVTPLSGKFALFEGTLAHFSFVINGGIGAGGTRHQLKPESVRTDGSISPATYGDTGVKFMGSVGAGFRLQLGERFAFRLEVRDVVYTARMEQVNGCNIDDLLAMDAKIRMNQPVETATVGGACRIEEFSGVYPDTGVSKAIDATLAKNLVQSPSSDVLNNVGLYLGVSFLF